MVTVKSTKKRLRPFIRSRSNFCPKEAKKILRYPTRSSTGKKNRRD